MFNKKEQKLEVEEIEEDQKPTAKKSSKRGRKSKKTTTKSLQESSEIAHDEKSNINESEISPEVKDTTINSKNVVLHNATENVTIDESIALESPEKLPEIVSPKVVTIVEVDLEESKKSTDTKDEVEDEKTEPAVKKINEAVETCSSEVINVLPPVVIETPTLIVEEIKTTEPVEEKICPEKVENAVSTISENIDEAVEPLEEVVCSDENQNVAPTISENKEKTIEPVVEMSSSEVETVIVPVESIAVVADASILSSNEVEKVEPAKQINCSEEVQDTAPIIDKEEEKVETMDCSEEVQDVASTTKSVEEVEKVEPVEAMNCSEEVQEEASSAILSVKTEKIEPVEEINRTVDVQDSTPMISNEKDEKIEPVMKNNEIEIKIKIEKDISDTPVEQEVPNKTPVKETRKSESYTVEQLENIEERCESPDLMEESIVTIMDSPPPMDASALPKDSTFSPVVDISINDSRPTIDVPLLKRNNPLRTSTPLAPKLFLKSTENQTSNRKLMLNPLEKSILKSNRRKRSLSMVEGESFMQRRVMFISPTVMDIESIDHKMMASFFEEKENSSKLNDLLIEINFNSYLIFLLI